VRLPAAARQAVEAPLRRRVPGEVRGHCHLARRGVEFEFDVRLLAACYRGAAAVLPAERDHEGAAHHGHGARIGVAVDGDADGHPFAGAEPGDDLSGNLDAGDVLA